MTRLRINGRAVTINADEQTPLLWVIRDEIGLKGTKFGHVGGRPTRSCVTQLGAVEGADITTIEGLDPQGDHPVQRVWREIQVPQCGYCQSGQIMQAAAMLKDFPEPTDADIDAVMTGNLCRCMTYSRIRQAIKQAVSAMAESKA
jgi:isoquinoline 1-oxidoreductase alpha subunit